MSSIDRLSRRTVLKSTAATVAGVALAGCSSGGGGDGGGGDGGGGGDATTTESGDGGSGDGDGGSGDGDGGSGSDDGSNPSFDGYLENVENYDGVVDETGSSSVEITVGVKANGANYGFGPAAIRVSSGTEVTWKWNGKGGSHNVVADNGDFESDLTDEEGHTFSQTFDASGTHKYYCQPHKALGMKGVVVVE